MNALVQTKAIDPDFVWEVVTQPDFAPDDTPSTICARWGYPEEVMRTREYMRIEAELQKEYARYSAVAMLRANRDDMFKKVQVENAFSMRESFHNLMMRLSGMEREERAAAQAPGNGFVLNINIPGSAPVQVSAVAAAADPSAQVQDVPFVELPQPSDAMRLNASINDEVLAE